MSIECVSSFIGASIAMLICNPMDILKTRLQVQSQIITNPTNFIYKDYIGSFKTIYKAEGWRGFYKGLNINIIIFASSNAIGFYVRDHCESLISSRFHVKRNHNANIIVSSLIGGIFAVLNHPLYIIRTRIQTQIFHDVLNNTQSEIENFIIKMYKLLKIEGIRRSFGGLPINIAWCAISFALTVTSFEFCKKLASKRMKFS